MNVQINDCTIRDGGYLLDKNSPAEFVKGVIDGLLAAHVDIIEIGFLQDNCGGETLVYPNSIASRQFVPSSEYAERFTGFCDNSRYSLCNLDDCDGNAFDYLKISFAKHESEEALKFIAGAKEKGYKVFANPMDAPSYTPAERSDMISVINEIRPYCFSVVDTFGTMHLDDLRTIFAQIDSELDRSIRIGLHSHNNLQLSNALAEEMIDAALESDRDLVIDASLYGMGRGAGNANTEIVASCLNRKLGDQYDIGVLFDTIECFITPLREKGVQWGYDLPMFVCGALGSHVDNISHIKSRGVESSRDIFNIVSELDEMKRRRYGVGYSKTDFSALDDLCDRKAMKGGEGDGLR